MESEKLLPTANKPTQKQSSYSRKLLVVPLLSLAALWTLYQRASAPPPSFDPASSCPVQPEPLDVGTHWVPKDDAEFVSVALDRLRGAIRIPTQSYDDMGNPGDDDRFDGLAKFSDYLEKTFPLLHETLTLEKLNTYARLYTWEGTNKALKPIVLMAHQDVVPVNPSTIDQWTHDPWAADLDKDGWIWGRGSTDCKNTLIGSLSAVQQLISTGFVPERTVILSFGFDEEISGRRSARFLAELLEKRYGKDGVSLIFDEGFTGVDKAYDTTFARFGLAEKGAVNLQLTVLTPGGHSSVPPKHTGVGIMSRLLVALEDHPSPVKLDGNPVLSYLQCAADYGNMDKKEKKRVKDPKAWPKFAADLTSGNDRESLILKAFLGTTQAADLITGGVKVNALPEYTSATINYRIDFHSTVADHFANVASILAPVVKSLNLTFSVDGSHEDVTNSVVRLDYVGESSIEPAPITPTEGPAWDLMGGTVKAIWEDAVVAPSGMIANTDTKWYWNVSKNIYRFVPSSLELLQNFHTVDERIHTDAHLSTIEFYYKLIQNTQGWKSP
ncbi:Gly-Xaa carboxypeptidase [Pseudohyphozyma bogoriensis]|nr:Gly-Xaa carboxypeptidase [Pseudohyphozyma bogoriensis]